jgi:hypothetical protein
MIRALNFMRIALTIKKFDGGRCSRLGPGCSSTSICFAAFIATGLSVAAVAPATSQNVDLASPGSSTNVEGIDSAPQRPPGTFEGFCKFSREPMVTRPAETDPLAPKIFNSSLKARGGDIIFLQGANLTPSARVFQETPDGTSSQISIVNRVGSNWIAALIPTSSSGAFHIRVVNEHGSSATIRINAAAPYHLETTKVAPGGRFRIFGQSLMIAECRPTILVGGYPAEVDLAASRDYMLVARAPLGIAPTDGAEVLVDNGGGLGPTALDGHVRVIAGIGDPLQLNVGWAASFDFATRVITTSAVCNGTTDDSVSIKRAISAASALGGAIVQLPVGTCRIGGTIDLESKVVLRGAGRNETILRYERDYPIFADSKDLVGLEDLQLLNAGTTQEGMVWRNNTKSFIRRVTLNMLVSRQWFLTDNRDFLFDDNIVMQTGSFDQQNPYRFDRSAGLLFTNNRSLNVNGSPTFQDVHDSAFLNNRFTRDAVSQNEVPVVVHHGFVMDFARRVSVVGNTFDVVRGPINNKQRNDGETILVEGGGPTRTESVGTVKAAGANFLSDPDNPTIPTPLGDRERSNLSVAIVSGNGVGQFRHVVGYDGGTVKVDPPWDVPPEAGSHYGTFVLGLERVLIVGNTLIGNPRGIWLYQTSIRDVLIERNEIRDGGGIYLRSQQNLASRIFTVQANTVIEDNTIINQTGIWMSHIILAGVSSDEATFGLNQLGIEVRRNIITANQINLSSTKEDYAAHEGYAAMVRVETQRPAGNFLPKLVGPIFQNNACINCERPFTVGVGVAGAIFSGNTAEPAVRSSIVRDLDFAGRPLGGSTETVIR